MNFLRFVSSYVFIICLIIWRKKTRAKNQIDSFSLKLNFYEWSLFTVNNFFSAVWKHSLVEHFGKMYGNTSPWKLTNGHLRLTTDENEEMHVNREFPKLKDMNVLDRDITFDIISLLFLEHYSFLRRKIETDIFVIILCFTRWPDVWNVTINEGIFFRSGNLQYG